MSCQRDVSQVQNGFRIPTPTVDELRKANSELFYSATGDSSWPLDRKICFGVSIDAADIPSNSAECSPQTGIVAGFVEAGGTLEVEVPRGSARRIDLYAYLQDLASPCPKMPSKLDGEMSLQTYRVAVIERIDLLDTEQVVNMKAVFPGRSQHLAQQLNYPASCLPRPRRSNPGFLISSGAQVATGGNFELRGRIGKPLHRPSSMSGGNFRLEAAIK